MKREGSLTDSGQSVIYNVNQRAGCHLITCDYMAWEEKSKSRQFDYVISELSLSE